MPNSWVFNTHYTYNPALANNVIMDSPLLIRSANATLPIRKNENYVLVKPIFGNDNYIFTEYGVVDKIEQAQPIAFSPEEEELNKMLKEAGRPPLRQEYMHLFNLKPKGELKENKELEDYSYSLLCIYRYLNPKRHFQQQFRSIPREDYETITNEQIYIARSAFGNLINSLPKESKYDFVLYAIEKFGTVEFKGIDFIEAYGFLWDYINENILSQGRYITSAYNMLKEKFQQTGIPIYEVGFIDLAQQMAESKKDFIADRISEQASYFFDVFEDLKQNNFSTNSLERMASENTDEERFKDLFKNRLWPVDMNL